MSIADASMQDRPLFSPTVAIALVLVGIFSFLVYLVLSAYAPDVRAAGDGRANAVSRSAIGFAGLEIFLKAQGIPVVVSRGLGEEATASASLIIYTPGIDTEPEQYWREGDEDTPPTLVVLPKWLVLPDPIHPGWVRKGRTLPVDTLQDQLEKMVAGTTLRRRNVGVQRPLTRVRGDQAGGVSPVAPVEEFQTLRGKGWTSIVSDGEGGIILAMDDDGVRFVLSDPDILNTHGLKHLANAELATSLIEGLREGDGPVVLDVTINGYRRSPNMLRLAFEPPLLGITIAAFVAAALMGLHAASRFGSPRQAGRAFAFGKQALADQSAGLIALAGREHHMAARYAAATRSFVARAIGVPLDASDAEIDQDLERLSREKKTSDKYSSLLRQAATAEDGSDVLRLARRLHRWRREMIHGR